MSTFIEIPPGGRIAGAGTGRRMSRRIASMVGAGALAVIVPAGCSPGDRARERTMVRDSAGVAIVDNAAAQWEDGQGWRLAPEPRLRIGAVEGAPEYQLNRVRDARRLASGEIAVANGGSGEIRIFSPQGEFDRAAGGEGGGPGEFQILGWIQVLAGDSLLAYDARAMRLSVFSPAGEFARSATLPAEQGGARIRPLGAFADGSLAGQGTQFSDGPPPNGLVRMPVTLSRLSPDGSVTGTIAALRGDERVVQMQSDAGSVVSVQIVGLPFHRRSLVAISDNRIYAADTDEYEIRQYGAGGELQRIIRRQGEPKQVTESDRAQFHRVRVEEATTDEQRTRIEQSRGTLEFPETMPAFSELRADAGGNLWVQEFHWPGEAGNRWSVFDPEGQWLGEVAMPERFEPTEIGEDYILGTWRDELDVEHVLLYPLVKD